MVLSFYNFYMNAYELLTVANILHMRGMAQTLFEIHHITIYRFFFFVCHDFFLSLKDVTFNVNITSL